MKSRGPWRPDPLIVARDGRGWMVSDFYMAARVSSLDPWGVDSPGCYDRKHRKYEPTTAFPRRFFSPSRSFARVNEMGRESETLAWPLGDNSVSFPNPWDGTDLWGWVNDAGATMWIASGRMADLVKVAGLDPEREYVWTCEGPASPLFVHDDRRWIGGVMPVRVTEVPELRKAAA